jgi:hypothetical protein
MKTICPFALRDCVPECRAFTQDAEIPCAILYIQIRNLKIQIEMAENVRNINNNVQEIEEYLKQQVLQREGTEEPKQKKLGFLKRDKKAAN